NACDDPPEQRYAQHTDEGKYGEEKSEDDEIKIAEFFQIEKPPAEQAGVRPKVDIHAVRTACDGGIVQKEIQHLRERECGHDQINASGTKHERANDQR